ncbi:MAG: glycosyltransferase family 4 protein, partial [Patescibacteria group bacterium]
GVLEAGKGIEAVLHTLADEHISIPLRIAGQGQLRERLEQFVDKNQLRWQVTFLGQLNDQQLAKEYADCAFVIAPSLQYETFGFTAVEAMAAGKPVLVSNLGALPELVDETVGAVFHADQPGSLAREIRGLMTRRDLALLGQAAYERAMERWSPDRHYQKIMAVYERAVASSGPSGGGVKKYY